MSHDHTVFNAAVYERYSQLQVGEKSVLRIDKRLYLLERHVAGPQVKRCMPRSRIQRAWYATIEFFQRRSLTTTARQLQSSLLAAHRARLTATLAHMCSDTACCNIIVKMFDIASWPQLSTVHLEMAALYAIYLHGLESKVQREKEQQRALAVTRPTSEHCSDCPSEAGAPALSFEQFDQRNQTISAEYRLPLLEDFLIEQPQLCALVTSFDAQSIQMMAQCVDEKVAALFNIAGNLAEKDRRDGQVANSEREIAQYLDLSERFEMARTALYALHHIAQAVQSR